MTKPDDIMQWAWDAARVEIGEWALAADLTHIDEEIIAESFARALMDERERCAKVAEGFSAHQDNPIPERSEREIALVLATVEISREDIAAAIRRGDA